MGEDFKKEKKYSDKELLNLFKRAVEGNEHGAQVEIWRLYQGKMKKRISIKCVGNIDDETLDEYANEAYAEFLRLGESGYKVERLRSEKEGDEVEEGVVNRLYLVCLNTVLRHWRYDIVRPAAARMKENFTSLPDELKQKCIRAAETIEHLCRRIFIPFLKGEDYQKISQSFGLKRKKVYNEINYCWEKLYETLGGLSKKDDTMHRLFKEMTLEHRPQIEKTNADPEESVIKTEIIRAVNGTIDKLPANEKKLITEKFKLGMSYKQLLKEHPEYKSEYFIAKAVREILDKLRKGLE